MYEVLLEFPELLVGGGILLWKRYGYFLELHNVLPLVTASRATPHPVAPPPITKTSNSGVYFSELVCTVLDGKGTFDLTTGILSAAFTVKRGF